MTRDTSKYEKCFSYTTACMVILEWACVLMVFDSKTQRILSYSWLSNTLTHPRLKGHLFEIRACRIPWLRQRLPKIRWNVVMYFQYHFMITLDFSSSFFLGLIYIFAMFLFISFLKLVFLLQGSTDTKAQCPLTEEDFIAIGNNLLQIISRNLKDQYDFPRNWFQLEDFKKPLIRATANYEQWCSCLEIGKVPLIHCSFAHTVHHNCPLTEEDSISKEDSISIGNDLLRTICLKYSFIWTSFSFLWYIVSSHIQCINNWRGFLASFCSARNFNKPFAVADSPRPSSLHPRDRREARDFISLPIRYLSHSRIHLRTFSIYRATSSPLKAASSLADLPLTLCLPLSRLTHSLFLAARVAENVSFSREVFILAMLWRFFRNILAYLTRSRAASSSLRAVWSPSRAVSSLAADLSTALAREFLALASRAAATLSLADLSKSRVIFILSPVL